MYSLPKEYFNDPKKTITTIPISSILSLYNILYKRYDEWRTTLYKSFLIQFRGQIYFPLISQKKKEYHLNGLLIQNYPSLSFARFIHILTLR